MTPDPSVPPLTDSQRLVRIETLLEEWHRTHDDHETRIRSLERRMWIAIGLAGGVGGVVGQAALNLFGQ